jgi:hypothetical protein
MTLAAILVFSLLSLGSSDAVPQAASAQAQPSPASNSGPASTSQQQNSTPPAPKHKPAHRKKAKAPDCATAPADSKSPNGQSSSTSTASTQANPCPPQKKIVKDGGTAEPTVQLKSDTKDAPDQVSTTEQLRAATEDNLKKIAGNELTADQQEMVNQIKQFVDQSKAAIAEGDLERGHNLAMKAKLLSDELASK